MNDASKSVKHSLISKSNSNMLIALGAAGAILSFSVVSGAALVKRMNYQSKVINQRVEAEKQLNANIAALDKLVTSYKAFDEAKESVIKTSDPNAKIVLDALPSKYDFPALATSVEKILLEGGFSNPSLGGSDFEATAEQSSVNPAPVEIPLNLSARGAYPKIQALLDKLQKSIRPIKINSISLSGNESQMSLGISAVTYYQPEKTLDIPLVEVK